MRICATCRAASSTPDSTEEDGDFYSRLDWERRDIHRLVEVYRLVGLYKSIHYTTTYLCGPSQLFILLG